MTFSFENTKAMIILPSEVHNKSAFFEVTERERVSSTSPWIWRTEFWDHAPQADVALVNAGFFLVFLSMQVSSFAIYFE
jgi:hypothetical protein